jgi:hypothetical protein
VRSLFAEPQPTRVPCSQHLSVAPPPRRSAAAPSSLSSSPTDRFLSSLTLAVCLIILPPPLIAYVSLMIQVAIKSTTRFPPRLGYKSPSCACLLHPAPFSTISSLLCTLAARTTCRSRAVEPPAPAPHCPARVLVPQLTSVESSSCCLVSSHCSPSCALAPRA